MNPLKDKELLASIAFQQEMVEAFMRHFPDRVGRVRVDISFEGAWVGWHFDPGVISADRGNHVERSGCRASTVREG